MACDEILDTAKGEYYIIYHNYITCVYYTILMYILHFKVMISLNLHFITILRELYEICVQA